MDNRFDNFSSSELASLQNGYYMELHDLREELEDLLNELQSISHNLIRMDAKEGTVCRNCL
jgi:hypothetical protein